MNIYILTQEVNSGYDTYDSCIVAAESEEDAAKINPSGSHTDIWESGTWADNPEQVKVTLIGIANEGACAGLIMSSFNAG